MFRLANKRLATQLIIIMMLLFAIAISTLSYFQYYQQLKSEKKFQLSQAGIILRNLSSHLADKIYSQQYTELKSILSNSIKFEKVSHVIVADNTGRVLAEARKDEAGIAPSDQKIVTPPLSIGMNYHEENDDYVIVWRRILLANEGLGWVHMDIAKSSIRKAAWLSVRNNIVINFGIYLLLSVAILFVTNRKLASLALLGNFMRGINRYAGETLKQPPVSEEIDDLVENMNDMSSRMARQRDDFISLAENLMDGLLVNVEGKHVFVNRSLATMLGYENAAELLGTTIEDVIYPGEFMKVLERQQGQLKGIDTDSQYETIFKTKQGAPLPVELNATITEWKGKKAGMMTVRDISARKRIEQELLQHRQNLEDLIEKRNAELLESEKKFRTLFEASNDAIMTLDTEKFIDCNQATLDIFSVKDRSEFLGKHPGDISPPAQPDGTPSHEAANERIATAFREGKNFFEWTHCRLNGEVFPAEVLLTPMELEGRQVLQAVVRDITKRKQSEENLISAKEEAEHANKAKSEFLSRVNHELRTPLNAIIGFGQLLQVDNENLTESQIDEVNCIVSGGTHLLYLIDELLGISGIQSGTVNVSISPVSVPESIATCLNLTRPLAEKYNVTVKANEVEHSYIHADSQRLLQVIINLVTNAIKYNRPGGSVEITAKHAEGDKVRISVMDTGIGIGKQDMERMFEPFSRLGGSASAIEGTGLGLTIVKELVELMNGKLEFASEEGKGSVFWVDFPRAEPQMEIDTVVKRGLPGPVERRSNLKVLYIEDSIDNQILMRHVIDKIKSCELIVATTADEGIEIAKAHHPDLILMDISLPGMDGFEALATIRSDASISNTPVIAISANVMPAQVEKGRQAGFDDYLHKPIDIQHLTNAIDSYCK